MNLSNLDTIWFTFKDRIIDSFINFGEKAISNYVSAWKTMPEWWACVHIIVGLTIMANSIRRVK